MSKIFGIKYVCLQNTQRKQNVLKLNKVLITIPSDLVRSFSNIASIANVVQCTSWESDHYDNCQRCQVRVLGSLFDGVCWIFFSFSLYFPFSSSLHSNPSTGEIESTSCNFVCLSVCLYIRHHFNISNLGPSNRPRIMLCPTHYTLLDRGWHQRWRWQWQRRTQRQRQWRRQNT